jgi:hypothetical protein
MAGGNDSTTNRFAQSGRLVIVSASLAGLYAAEALGVSSAIQKTIRVTVPGSAKRRYLRGEGGKNVIEE